MSKRLYALMAALVAGLFLLTACGGAATQAPVLQTVPIDTSAVKVSLADLKVPQEGTSGLVFHRADLTSLEALQAYCDSVGCTKATFGRTDLFVGVGWVYQGKTEVYSGTELLASQIDTAVYPEDPETGLIAWPSDGPGEKNIFITIPEAAARLVKEAENTSEDKSENRATKLGDDLVAFGNALTNEGGQVCVLKKNGNLTWINPIAAAQRPVENNALSKDCLTDTPKDEGLGEIDSTDPGKSEDRNPHAFDVCLVNGQPKKCGEAGIEPLPEGTPLLLNDPTRTGWNTKCGDLPNDKWTCVQLDDGSLKVCNPGGQCSVIPAPTDEEPVSLDPTATPLPGATEIPALTATPDPFTNPAEQNCPGGSCSSSGVPSGFNPVGQAAPTAAPAYPPECYNSAGNVYGWCKNP